MAFKDYFSKQASAYARHRPQYPPALFAYLSSIVPNHEVAWDCGTGNGQAALGLAPYFDHVIATDPSEEQLRNAFQHEKITYKLAQAENPGIEPHSVDLVTVAQAIHWFEIDKFFEEARKALKPGGTIAIWTYSLCKISPEIDPIIDSFYFDTVGPYWPPQRKLVDEGYRSLVFPFDELTPPAFSIQLNWNMEDMLGYMRTWSPTRIFIQSNGYDPVDQIEGPLEQAWGNSDEERLVVWPIHMRVGKTNSDFGF